MKTLFLGVATPLLGQCSSAGSLVLSTREVVGDYWFKRKKETLYSCAINEKVFLLTKATSPMSRMASLCPVPHGNWKCSGWKPVCGPHLRDSAEVTGRRKRRDEASMSPRSRESSLLPFDVSG
jgi:hypothetical protein